VIKAVANIKQPYYGDDGLFTPSNFHQKKNFSIQILAKIYYALWLQTAVITMLSVDLTQDSIEK